VDSVTLDNLVILSDGTVTATASLSDVDSSQSVTANYEWFVNGSSVQNGSSSTLDGSYFVKGDDVYVDVTPNDGDEDGTPMSSNSIVIGNTAPSNVLVSVTSSDNFNNDSILTCSATADDYDVDENVDSLTYTYTWSTGDTGATLDLAGSVTPGTTLTCDVTVTDGDDSASGSDSQQIANRTPTVTASLPTSVTAATSSVTCTGSATDLDGTTPTLSYGWTIDGTPVSETSSTLSGPFIVNQSIACGVTADDGIATGSATASVSVSNTAPVVDSVTMTSSAYTNDTLSASSVLSDIDSTQTLVANYEWIVNGASIQSGTTTTLDGTVHFDRDDSVYVVVTPNDGVENGIPVQSSSLTISNTAPTAPGVAVTSASTVPLEGVDDLTCEVTIVSTDADNDSLNYTYNCMTQMVVSHKPVIQPIFQTFIQGLSHHLACGSVMLSFPMEV
jgi:hypothetical protein